MDFVWESLKRALRAREIKVQPLELQLGLLSTTTLEPQPIPLNINVVLIGKRWLHQMLMRSDPEFMQLFKVYADFAEDITRERASVAAYVRRAHTLARSEQLRPLSQKAVARVVEQAAHLGMGKMLDIERESELGGPLHSKGVLILQSFIANRFAATRPLFLSASLVIEQSYGPVDGDSASLAELCGLLSAIARVPLRQNFAVTGSVDQFGRVQAVGSVN